MLEFSKKILLRVSFDKDLFKKELQKNASWMSRNDIIVLIIWALTSFSQYKNIILEVFDNIS